MDDYFSKTLFKNDNPELLLNCIVREYDFGIACLGYLYSGKYTSVCCVPRQIDIDPSISYKSVVCVDSKEVTSSIRQKCLIVPLYTNTSINGYLILFSDTDIDKSVIKRLTRYLYVCEKIVEKYNTDKNSFIANISHEIRTPLNGIVGYSQLLSGTNLDITQKNYVNSISQCSGQLMQIISDVLDYSKLQSGKMKTNNECFSIREVVAAIEETLAYRIREKRITHSYNIDRNIPNYIVGDKNKIVQILVNLVSNSIKFTNSYGKISIGIVYESTDILRFSVTDTGIGIRDEELETVFEEYYQSSSKNTASGTGLGLSICKKLAQLLGGNISCTSKYGQGSVFSFYIKFKPYEMEERRIINRDDTSILKDKYALVVDDNSTNRVILCEMLFEWGMFPIACASPFEALRFILSSRYCFSVALIDICMPITNGIELARQIKEENPYLPLVALSSLDDTCHKLEKNDFEEKIYKPVNKVALFDILKRVISDTKITSNLSRPKETREYRILIAEDVSYNLTLLENMLANLGHTRVSSCEDGKQVIESLSREKYDILFLDLRMPNVDGFEVIDWIKRNGTDIKIVPVSASILEEDRERCIKYGITDFLTKPIDLKILKNILL